MSNQTDLGSIMGTLDELAAATRNDDAPRYRKAFKVATGQGITEEQIRDAHDWGGQRAIASPRFDWQGRT